jgi:hypothetical protein
VNGAGEITLHATEAAADALGGTPEAIVLSGVPGQTPRVTRIAMERTAPDLFRAVFPLHGEDVALPTVELPGGARHTLAPLVLPYPAELRPETDDRGPELLRWSPARRGVERVALDAAWRVLPARPQQSPHPHSPRRRPPRRRGAERRTALWVAPDGPAARLSPFAPSASLGTTPANPAPDLVDATRARRPELDGDPKAARAAAAGTCIRSRDTTPGRPPWGSRLSWMHSKRPAGTCLRDDSLAPDAGQGPSMSIHRPAADLEDPFQRAIAVEVQDLISRAHLWFVGGCLTIAPFARSSSKRRVTSLTPTQSHVPR